MISAEEDLPSRIPPLSTDNFSARCQHLDPPEQTGSSTTHLMLGTVLTMWGVEQRFEDHSAASPTSCKPRVKPASQHVALLTLSAPRSLTLQLIREIESFPIRRSGQGISPPDGMDPESADMIQTYCLSLPAPLQPSKNSHHKMSIKTWSLLSLCPKKAKELAKGRDLSLLTLNPGNAVSTTR